jgi:hypothetical protein
MPFLWHIRPTAAAEGVRHSTVDPSTPRATPAARSSRGGSRLTPLGLAGQAVLAPILLQDKKRRKSMHSKISNGWPPQPPRDGERVVD